MTSQHATHTPTFDPTCSTCWRDVTSDNITSADPVSCGPGCIDGRHSWEYADPLQVDSEPWPPMAVRPPDEHPEAVIVWVGGALLLAVITAIVVMAWRTVR